MTTQYKEIFTKIGVELNQKIWIIEPIQIKTPCVVCNDRKTFVVNGVEIECPNCVNCLRHSNAIKESHIIGIDIRFNEKGINDKHITFVVTDSYFTKYLNNIDVGIHHRAFLTYDEANKVLKEAK